MKTWKLVSGILSIVLSVFITFQSLFVGLGNILSGNGETGGSAGIIVAILLITSGITSIVTRNDAKNGGNIAIFILCGIAAFFGFTQAGRYLDLYVWSTWSSVCAVTAVIGIALNGNSRPGKKENEYHQTPCISHPEKSIGEAVPEPEYSLQCATGRTGEFYAYCIIMTAFVIAVVIVIAMVVYRTFYPI